MSPVPKNFLEMPKILQNRIRKEVYQETGLTISAGVAASKLVAKIASDINKPDGLTIVPVGKEAEFLAPLPIRRLWGVGKKTQETLSLLGVHTIGDIASLPEKLLEQKFGKHGISLRRKALGLDNRDVETEHETKSVGHEFTFDTDLVELETIRRELLELAVMVAKRLRRYQLQGKTITLKVKYHDFKQITRSSTIKQHSADSKCIYEKYIAASEKNRCRAGTHTFARYLCFRPETRKRLKTTVSLSRDADRRETSGNQQGPG